MALNRKYAALPDLDSAPDIYETPELTDDNSTAPGTTLRSPSDPESDGDTPAISRANLRIDDARSRFDSARYNSSRVDFSDRVDTKRRAYRSSTRRYRTLRDGTEELGDLSDELPEDEDDDDDAKESLERKIARLRREVEEAKEEHARRKAAEASQGKRTAGDEAGDAEDLSSLAQVLDELSRPSGTARATRPIRLPPHPAPADQSADPSKAAAENISEATYTLTYAPHYEQTHALAKTAEFEQRLLTLERSIGTSSQQGLSLLNDPHASNPPRALLPTLEALHRQVSVLSQASTTTLDAISRRVRALAADIETMAKAERARQFAREAEEGFRPSTAGQRDDPSSRGENRLLDRARSGSRSLVKAADAGAEDGGEEDEKRKRMEQEDQTAKVNALYGTLPTIENLAPLLQPLLDRLRSLRAIHADAATASEALDRVERSQAETAAELRQWREGIEKISGAMAKGEEAMAGNMQVMESWVKDIEDRVQKLST